MCLIKMKVSHDDDPSPPPRRIVVRPASSSYHGSDHIVVSSRPVSRSPSRSHRSSRIISSTVLTTTQSQPLPAASQYIRAPARLSNPRIVYAHAPSPGPSPRSSVHRHSRSDVIFDAPPRSSAPFLAAPGFAPRGALGAGVEAYGGRGSHFLDDAPMAHRSRSITYATTGPRLSRERVVVEESGRRRESYRPMRGV